MPLLAPQLAQTTKYMHLVFCDKRTFKLKCSPLPQAMYVYVCTYVHVYSIAPKLLCCSSLGLELNASIYVAVFQEGRVHCGQRLVLFRSSSVSVSAQYFMLLVTLLQTNQSVEMLQHIFAFIRCFIHKVSSIYILLCFNVL